ncbi:hypothetical protein KR054_002065 [Drosophila jambulina]|nr:hypothetical protein KR054_002065 [Drosophila jambulina]
MSTSGPGRPPRSTSRPYRSSFKAPGCSVAKLRSFVERSNLADHLRHFSATRNVVEQVERHFRILMRGIKFWELDRIQPLFSGLCMLILTKESHSDDLCYKRSGLMGRFIEFVDCVPPMIAHQLIEKLLEDLAEYQVDSGANLLKLAVKLADLGYRGRVLAVCLLWSLLGRCLPALEITMHRFREPGELAEAIRKKPPISPSVWLEAEGSGTANNNNNNEARQEHMEALRVMLEAMERLLDLLLCCDNDDLQEEGYPEQFFTLEGKDSTFLSDWCIDLSKELPVEMCGPRGKFGAPLHGIIGTLMEDREAKVRDNRVAKVKETKAKVPDVDASMVVEVTLNAGGD